MPRKVVSVHPSEENVQVFQDVAGRLKSFSDRLESSILFKRLFRFEIKALRKLSDQIGTENRILTMFEKLSQVKLFKKKMDEKLGTIKEYVHMVAEYEDISGDIEGFITTVEISSSAMAQITKRTVKV